MKNSFTSSRLGGLSWYMWILIVSFASLVGSCGCLKKNSLDPSPDTPTASPLRLKKACYDRDNNRLVAIIENTGKEVAKDLSLRCTNISKDVENRQKVLLNNNLITTTIPIPELAASSSTGEIYVPINLQTTSKTLVQIEIRCGGQVITTTSIPVNAHLIDLIPIGPTASISKQGQEISFKCRLETYGEVDFSKVRLSIINPNKSTTKVLVDGKIILDATTGYNKIEGDTLQKLAQKEEILVSVTNNTPTDEPITITYILYDGSEEIAKIENLLIRNIQKAFLPAIMHGNTEVVQEAITNGADVNQKEADITMLTYAVHYGHSEIVELLIKNRADVNLLSKDAGNEFTALVLAVWEVRPEIVDILIQNGAKITDVTTIKNGNGYTAWEEAIKDGHQAIVEVLVKNGVKINTPDENGNTALHIAIKHRQPGIIEVFTKNGANINIKNNNKWTPWETAVALDDSKVVEALIRGGMDINIKDEDGLTPLHWAAKHNNVEVIKLLLQSGADKTIKDSNGKTAADLAKNKDTKDLINNWRT